MLIERLPQTPLTNSVTFGMLGLDVTHYRPGIERRDSGFDLCLLGWDAQQGV